MRDKENYNQKRKTTCYRQKTGFYKEWKCKPKYIFVFTVIIAVPSYKRETENQAALREVIQAYDRCRPHGTYVVTTRVGVSLKCFNVSYYLLENKYAILCNPQVHAITNKRMEWRSQLEQQHNKHSLNRLSLSFKLKLIKNLSFSFVVILYSNTADTLTGIAQKAAWCPLSESVPHPHLICLQNKEVRMHEQA